MCRVSASPASTYTLNKVKGGEKFTTGTQVHPWIELDLGAQINIIQVISFNLKGVFIIKRCWS